MHAPFVQHVAKAIHEQSPWWLSFLDLTNLKHGNKLKRNPYTVGILCWDIQWNKCTTMAQILCNYVCNEWWWYFCILNQCKLVSPFLLFWHQIHLLSYKKQIVESILNVKHSILNVLISLVTKKILQPPNEVSICWQQDLFDGFYHYST